MAEFAAHTVKSFDEDIAQLRAVITRLGGLVESQIAESVDWLLYTTDASNEKKGGDVCGRRM